MSVSKIGLKNYKAFESVSIDVKSITVMIGANSSGKSSLLQIPLLLSQSYYNNEKKNLPLKLYGKYVDFGDIENIFFNKDKSKIIEMSFVPNKPIDIYKLLRQMLRSLPEFLLNIHMESYRFLNKPEAIEKPENSRFIKNIMSLSKYKSSLDKSEDIHSILNDLQAFLDETKKSMKEASFVEEVMDSKEVSIKRKIPAKIDNIDLTLKIIRHLSKIEAISSIKYGFSYNHKENNVEISFFEINNNEQSILKVVYLNSHRRSVFSIESDVIPLGIVNKIKKNCRGKINFKGLSLGDKVERDVPLLGRSSIKEDAVVHLVQTLFHISISRLFAGYKNIRHVSPIRAYPQRYYMVGDFSEFDTWNTFDKNQLVHILKTKPEIREKINYWLKRFDVEINVEKLTHILHSIKVEQNGLKLDLTDVGFGISQILPVIIQPLLAENDSITVIEQPEIHIHPKAQADLADFFISIVKNTNKKLIIETHSEAFLRRLRRRMAESKVEMEGSISPEQVSINYISKVGGGASGSVLQQVDISSSGAFEWPRDFMDIDIDDTINFIKYQG